MFKKQPRPPHSENLTDAQVKMLRKMIKTEWDFTLWRLTDKILEKGAPEVLVAYARQPKTRQSEIEWVFVALYQQPTAEKHAVHLQLLSAIEKMDAKFRGVRLGIFLSLIKNDVEMIKQALAAMPNSRVHGEALLCLIKERDIADEAKAIDLLLAGDIDLHFEKAALIKECLLREHYAIADRLLDKGFDLSLYSQDLIKFSIENDMPHAARVYLDDILRKAGLDAKPAPVTAVIEVTSDDTYIRTGDSVSRVDALPDGSVLSTVFNFASGQQLIIARMGDNISTPAVVNFSAIEERHQLENAAKAYMEQGGNADLAARFVTVPKRLITGKPEAKS